MKKELLEKILVISNRIDKAKVESIKSQLYYDGYFDCLKEILSGDNSFFLDILQNRYEGKSKQEAYNDVSEIILSLKSYIESLPDSDYKTELVDFSIHPNERAKSFLDRKNKEK